MKPPRLFAVLALLVAWSCSDDKEAPPPGTNPPKGGAAGSSGSSGRGGSGGSNGGEPSGGTSTGGAAAGEGGGAGEANGGAGGTGTGGSSTGGTGGGAGYPSCPSDSGGGSPPELTGVCDMDVSWGPLVDVPLMDGASQLVSVTPDELTMVWLGYAEMSTRAYVADRASSAEDFATAVLLGEGNYATLSPDGLRLVALSDDGGFVEFVRTARGEAFGITPVETSFTALNADASANETTLSAPVIAPDDRTLFYLVNDGQGSQVLHTSTRGGSSPWPAGSAVVACEFEMQQGLVRIPTGVSSDGLTLFYDDLVRGISRAAWRETPDDPFTVFVDLGSRRRSQPNTACNRLYFTDQTGPAYADAQ